MSPPIFTPDGSEVSEIVLPDGSTASQVIGPDGNVVFEAAPDIPDTGLLHNYDPRKLSFNGGDTVSTRVDQNADGDLGATNTPGYVADGINGNPIVRYNGTDEYHQGTFGASISPPFEIFHVFQARAINQSERYFSGESNTVDWLVFGEAGNPWGLNDGSNSLKTSSSSDTNAHIGVARFASDSEIQLETTLENSGNDLSNNSLGGVTIGADSSGSNNATIDSGQFLIYDPTANGYDRSQIVSYLIGEWGPF